MIESLVLGAVQGVLEWLPVSSEAAVVLVQQHFFSTEEIGLTESIHYAIYLHLGTVLAAIVYFWKTIIVLVKKVFNYVNLPVAEKKFLDFIVVTTLISGIFGFAFVRLVESFQWLFTNTLAINLLVTGFLLITAFLLWINERQSRDNTNHRTEFKLRDGIITGTAQAFAAFPGISRSGTTLAALGLLGFEKRHALETSFILSIPLVILANIVLNLEVLTTPSLEQILGLLTAFVFGIITIKLLLNLVERVRFSIFVLLFATLLGLVSLIIFLS